jgi:hypothetical protein
MMHTARESARAPAVHSVDWMTLQSYQQHYSPKQDAAKIFVEHFGKNVGFSWKNV